VKRFNWGGGEFEKAGIKKKGRPRCRGKENRRTAVEARRKFKKEGGGKKSTRVVQGGAGVDL